VKLASLGAAKAFVAQMAQLFLQSSLVGRVFNHLNSKADPGNGRSQLMRDGMNHFPLHLYQALDLLSHTVEGARQA
jgi:hypothetical protein